MTTCTCILQSKIVKLYYVFWCIKLLCSLYIHFIADIFMFGLSIDMKTWKLQKCRKIVSTRLSMVMIMELRRNVRHRIVHHIFISISNKWEKMNIIFMCIDLSFTMIVCCWRVSWNNSRITTHFSVLHIILWLILHQTSSFKASDIDIYLFFLQKMTDSNFILSAKRSASYLTSLHQFKSNFEPTYFV